MVAPLLGRDVGRRAEDLPGAAADAVGVERLGDAEVGELDRPLAVDQQVLRLDVAVDDPSLVGHAQRLGDLLGGARRAGPGQLAAVDQPGVQRLAVDVLEHQIRLAAGLAAGVHAHDVRVVERAHQLGFARDPLGALGVVVGVEQLDDVARVVAGAVGQVDHAHAAGGQALAGDVVAEPLADVGVGGQRHRVGLGGVGGQHALQGQDLPRGQQAVGDQHLEEGRAVGLGVGVAPQRRVGLQQLLLDQAEVHQRIEDRIEAHPLKVPFASGRRQPARGCAARARSTTRYSAAIASARRALAASSWRVNSEGSISSSSITQGAPSGPGHRSTRP